MTMLIGTMIRATMTSRVIGSRLIHVHRDSSVGHIWLEALGGVGLTAGSARSQNQPRQGRRGLLFAKWRYI